LAFWCFMFALDVVFAFTNLNCFSVLCYIILTGYCTAYVSTITLNKSSSHEWTFLLITAFPTRLQYVNEFYWL